MSETITDWYHLLAAGATDGRVDLTAEEVERFQAWALASPGERVPASMPDDYTPPAGLLGSMFGFDIYAAEQVPA